MIFFSLAVKVKHKKKETECRRITKYVNSITATEGPTQPSEFVDFTFLIHFWEWEWATGVAIHWAFSPCSPVPSSLTFSHSQVTLPGSSELQQAGVRNLCLLKPSFLQTGKAEQSCAAQDSLHLSDLSVGELSPLSPMSRAKPPETGTRVPQWLAHAGGEDCCKSWGASVIQSPAQTALL